MQSYEVRCPVHGVGDTFGEMKQAIDKTLPCFADGCTETVERWYHRGTYASDHSENTFKPWYSENLTIGDTPVMVKSREHQQALMDQMGVRIYEAGETKDVRDRKKRHQEELRKATRKGLQEVLEYRARQG